MNMKVKVELHLKLLGVTFHMGSQCYLPPDTVS